MNKYFPLLITLWTFNGFSQNEMTSEKVFSLIESVGYPSTKHIDYHAFSLEYAENFEQAKWVMHVVPPKMDQISNKHKNRFKADPNIKTGSCVKADYRFKEIDEEGKSHSTGHGYQRGHLAPRADFKWSDLAIDQSYFYSNASPQVGALNQKKWNELEGQIRRLASSLNQPLIILTAPVLTDDLDTLKGSINHVRIPKYFVKAIYNPAHEKAIAFMMKNEKQPRNLIFYTKTINEVEKELGFDIFPQVPESIESTFQILDWFETNDLPLNYRFVDQNHLSKSNVLTGAYASKMANSNYEIIICDSVFGVHESEGENLWVNLGDKYPKNKLSIFIKKEDRDKFTNDFDTMNLTHQCFRGKVKQLDEIPSIRLYDPEQIIDPKKLNLTN
jgi:endonuclease G